MEKDIPLMTATQQLLKRRCVPCEGGIEKMAESEIARNLSAVPGWRMTHDGTRLRQDYLLADFMAGVELFQAVAALAEAEDHHPDLHLENFRFGWLELHTHAAGGLTENDFILAAKINQIPVRLKFPRKVHVD